MSSNACGSIHQGHERVILVATLEEDSRFLCLAALLIMWVIFADSRMEPGAKISMKSFFMEIIFCPVHSVAVLFYGLGKNTSTRSKLPNAVCERKERKVWSQLLYVESESNHSQYSSTVEVFNLIVESKSLSAEVNDLNIGLHLLVEVKKKACNHIVLWILISLLQCDHIIIPAMMQFVMTFGGTLRDGSSFGKLANLLC